MARRYSFPGCCRLSELQPVSSRTGENAYLGARHTQSLYSTDFRFYNQYVKKCLPNGFQPRSRYTLDLGGSNQIYVFKKQTHKTRFDEARKGCSLLATICGITPVRVVCAVFKVHPSNRIELMSLIHFGSGWNVHPNHSTTPKLKKSVSVFGLKV